MSDLTGIHNEQKKTTNKVYPNPTTIKPLYGCDDNRLYMNWRVQKIARLIQEPIIWVWLIRST